MKNRPKLEAIPFNYPCNSIKAAAVFIGRKGIGPWQSEEMQAFLIQFVQKKRPVIPVLLGSARKKPKIPPFLGNRTWVDFRVDDPDPMDDLVWGITGKKS